MAKSKRSNYLIDKPFQLGFITRFLVIILITIFFIYLVVGFYYWFISSIGELKYDVNVIYSKRDYIKFKGNQVYDYPKEKIEIYKEITDGKVIYKCYKPYLSNYKQGDIIQNVSEADLKKLIGKVDKTTTPFKMIFFPLLWTCIALILIISIYSLFFSHRMAGPIYRIRVSLDKMLASDYDFKIKARKTDFFLNIVTRLDELRQKILNLKAKDKKSTPKTVKDITIVAKKKKKR